LDIESCQTRGWWSGDTVKYSVPYDHILELAVVRDTGDEIIVYGPQLEIVARHERASRGHGPVIEPAHHPAKPRRNDIELLTHRISKLDDAGAEFAAGVLRTQRYRGVHLAQVLALVEHYALDDLVNALKRANRYHAFDAKSIQRILQMTAKTRNLPDMSHEAASRRLATAAAQTGVAARPIADYARALANKRMPKPEDD